MKPTTTIILAFLLLACSSGPDPISYGSDACHFCKMTIVDKPFGCELVSSKGKVMKFDAIECLVAHYKETGSDTTYNVYVADFAAPGTLIDGYRAHYLQCEAIPSPMGAFLSAHGSMESARTTLQNGSGEIYDWDSLLKTEF